MLRVPEAPVKADRQDGQGLNGGVGVTYGRRRAAQQRLCGGLSQVKRSSLWNSWRSAMPAIETTPRTLRGCHRAGGWSSRANGARPASVRDDHRRRVWPARCGWSRSDSARRAGACSRRRRQHHGRRRSAAAGIVVASVFDVSGGDPRQREGLGQRRAVSHVRIRRVAASVGMAAVPDRDAATVPLTLGKDDRAG